MCGIAGIHYFHGSTDLTKLKQDLNLMAEKLIHRGPDAQGVELYGEFGGFAHRRLSIIDLEERSNQPYTSNGASFLTYNGEVYNFKELRLKDFNYRTSSDTEVVYSNLQRDVDSFLKKANGMFAFGFWDEKSKELVLARDPMGIKPLYYYLDEEKLVFASEIKAIAMLEDVDLALSEHGVGSYLELGFTWGEQTAFKHIKQLKPGHKLSLNDNTVRVEQFFNFDLNAVEPYDLKTYEELITSASDIRLVSDVPLTCYLSGGIDSSTIAYVTKGKVSLSTLDLKGGDYSEIDKATLVAKTLGCELDLLEQRDFKTKDLLKVSYYTDDLNCDPALLSNFLLYEATAKKYKVGISGDGADELFLGYHTHRATLLSERVRSLPLKRALQLTAKGLGYLNSIDAKYSLAAKLDRFAEHYQKPFPYNHLSWRSPGLGKVNKLVYEFKGLPSLSRYGDMGQKMSVLDLMTYLTGNILLKVDRMSMAHSLEVRVPFLDTRVVQYALSMQKKYKLQGKKQKIIMKEFLVGKFPSEIINQQKKGFGINLKNVYNPLDYKERLLDHDSRFHQYIDRKLLEESYRELNAYQHYCLINFKLWLENFL